LVATNAESIAKAYFYEDAWFQAIYADETPVGFLMILDVPEKTEYFLWRFLIDAQYQKSNYGRPALELLIDNVRRRPNDEEFYVNYLGGAGSPAVFYNRCGFEPTSVIDDGDIVAKMIL
jgi:diamine N-acetyltransferase